MCIRDSFCAWLLRRREMKGEDGQRAETVKTGNGNAAAGVPSSQEPGAGPTAGNKSDAVLVAAAVAAYLAVDPDEIVVRRITRVEDCDLSLIHIWWSCLRKKRPDSRRPSRPCTASTVRSMWMSLMRLLRRGNKSPRWNRRRRWNRMEKGSDMPDTASHFPFSFISLSLFPIH